MLENLEKLIREQAQGAIVNNSDVPNEKNDAAIQAASSSIIDTLKEKISSGDSSGLADIFKRGGDTSSRAVQDVSSNFTNKLQGLGINLDSAKGIAASLIPLVIEQFTKKTADPNDSSFNLQDIVSNLAGPDGKFQLSDLGNLFSGDNSADGNSENGGIADKLKGLF